MIEQIDQTIAAIEVERSVLEEELDETLAQFNTTVEELADVGPGGPLMVALMDRQRNSVHVAPYTTLALFSYNPNIQS